MTAYCVINGAELEDIIVQDRLLKAINSLWCPIDIVQDSTNARFIVCGQTLVKELMIRWTVYGQSIQRHYKLALK